MPLGYLYSMLSYGQAFYHLKNKLHLLYDEREAAAIAHEILQHLTGLDRTQRLLQKDELFTREQESQYEQMTTDLLHGKPLQYVTGSAWFMGREFLVNEHVLIPRPETEELVDWIITSNKFPIPNSKILDIGTGSGCIPISLKLALPHAEVASCDISIEAIEVAKENASRLKADISFMQLDFLNAQERNKLGSYDVIVSNPPYIPHRERANMHANVKDWEPAQALFVSDEDALIFYRAIALFGREHLNRNGYIYCELESGHAQKCKALFEEAGYKNVEIKKDIHGNWRMLKCGLEVRDW